MSQNSQEEDVLPGVCDLCFGESIGACPRCHGNSITPEEAEENQATNEHLKGIIERERQG